MAYVSIFKINFQFGYVEKRDYIPPSPSIFQLRLWGDWEGDTHIWSSTWDTWETSSSKSRKSTFGWGWLYESCTSGSLT